MRCAWHNSENCFHDYFFFSLLGPAGMCENFFSWFEIGPISKCLPVTNIEKMVDLTGHTIISNKKAIENNNPWWHGTKFCAAVQYY